MQAHLATVETREDVEEAMEALLQNNKIRSATHNIMAFRIKLAGSDTYVQVSLVLSTGTFTMLLS